MDIKREKKKPEMGNPDEIQDVYLNNEVMKISGGIYPWN